MTSPLDEAARDLLDVDQLQESVERVLTDELYWFPVRHHSPAVARQVEAAVLRRRPRLIFLEGPSEAEHLIPHLTDRKTRPPVAIYTNYRDDANVLGLAGILSPAEDVPARFASWYPLLDYSPELATFEECLAELLGTDPMVESDDGVHYRVV